MTDTSELDALILRNIVDLDGAMRRAEEIDGLLWDEAHIEIEQVGNREGWHVAPTNEEVTWFAFPEWKSSGEEEDYEFAVQFEARVTTDTRHEVWTYLPQFVGKGPPQSGLVLFVAGSARKNNKALWKGLRQTHPAVFAQLESFGFSAGGINQPMLPVVFDAEDLAKGFELGDLTAAFAPLRDALDKVAKARPHLARLVSEQ